MKRHVFTEEEKEFLKDNVKGLYTSELTKIFNEKFNLKLKKSQIKNAKKRYKLKSGYHVNGGQFRKNHSPWNKGIKTGIIPPNAWEKGHEFNNKDIGSERVCSKDGYIIVKIEQPNVWEHKHRVLWKKYNGPIPEGSVVIFGDGDKRNFDLNNLILVSRKQLLGLNRHDLIQNDAELTRTSINIVDLNYKISQIDKGE